MTERSTLLVVITIALLSVAVDLTLIGAAHAQAGAPYTPPGYSLVVPAPTAQPTTQVVAGPVLLQPPAPETQSIRGLWIPGLVGLPLSYVATWMVASVTLAPGASGLELAYIPVLGPWLVLGAGSNGGDEGFYATMGVVQAVSLVCLVVGLAVRIPKPAADAPSFSLRPSSSGAMSATLQF